MVRSNFVLLAILILVGTSLSSGNRHLDFSEFVATGDHLQEEFAAISPEAKTAANKVLVDHTFRYVILKDAMKSLVPDMTGPTSATYADLCNKLPATEPRFAVFFIDVKGKTKTGLILWTPDAAKVGPKMFYYRSETNLKKNLPAFSFEINASSIDDLTSKDVLKLMS